jgi:glucose-6-phosphate isomerase
MSELLNCERLGTEYAFIASKRPSMTIAFDEISPYTVGQFIYLLEASTSIAGMLFGIDAYDQPAVELGKEATFALMGSSDYAALAEKIKPFSQVDEKYVI